MLVSAPGSQRRPEIGHPGDPSSLVMAGFSLETQTNPSESASTKLKNSSGSRLFHFIGADLRIRSPAPTKGQRRQIPAERRAGTQVIGVQTPALPDSLDNK